MTEEAESHGWKNQPDWCQEFSAPPAQKKLQTAPAHTLCNGLEAKLG